MAESSSGRKTETLDVRAALKEAMARLRDRCVASHTLAAELLLMHVLGRDRAWLYAHCEEVISPEDARRYFDLVAHRAAGVPTQYLTGRQEFWGLDFEVTPDVLIPRPETEHVVEVALERLGPAWARTERAGFDAQGRPSPDMTARELPFAAGRAAPRSQEREKRGELRIADVGTGSGCLAVALAHELPRAAVIATDISGAALAVARRNAARHGVAERIHFLRCNLLDGLRGDSPLAFDLIVSNPPYVGRGEAELLPVEVRNHEPARALFAGEQGCEIYAPLIAQAQELLAPGGILVLELGHNSLERVRPLLAAPGWTEVAITNDLAGIPRVFSARRF